MPQLLSAAPPELKLPRATGLLGEGNLCAPRPSSCVPSGCLQTRARSGRRASSTSILRAVPRSIASPWTGKLQRPISTLTAAPFTRGVSILSLSRFGPFQAGVPEHPRHRFRAPARVVAARALDPINGRVVHEDVLFSATQTTAVTPSAGVPPTASKPSSSGPTQFAPATASRSPAGPEPLTRWRVALLTLRHFPELADQVILQFTTRLIADEQAIWTRLDQLETTPRPNVNPKRPRFTYEWQKAIEAQPDFARGALLDLFMKPDADWSFVKREPEWDERFTAAVAAFLFARDKIEGRQAGFAAQELAPVAKQHLEMAVAAAPTNLWFPMKLVPWDYDFAAQAINFRVGEMLETPKGWFDDSYTVMPPSASATANHAPISTVDGPASQAKEFGQASPSQVAPKSGASSSNSSLAGSFQTTVRWHSIGNCSSSRFPWTPRLPSGWR